MVSQDPRQLESVNSNYETPQPSKHLYGSPQRKAGIQQLYDQQPANDFFAGFGKGGAGAPIRDQHGNVITQRKAVVDWSAVKSQSNSVDVKERQRADYANELQMQIQEKRAKKEQEAERLRLVEEREEARIRAELNVLNERDRREMFMERADTAPAHVKGYS